MAFAARDAEPLYSRVRVGAPERWAAGMREMCRLKVIHPVGEVEGDPGHWLCGCDGREVGRVAPPLIYF